MRPDAGAKVDECTLFATTFPCHHCARHIVAAGIRRVVYVAPYAKSRAVDLHDDAIVLGPTSERIRGFPLSHSWESGRSAISIGLSTPSARLKTGSAP